jgi:septal ring factor EnvC (AmiA/AmiB activator)
LSPSMRAQEREVYMPAHKPQSIEVRLQRIQQALEQKPDRDDLVQYWSSTLEFKLEELHEDVRDVQGELADVKDKIDDLQSEDR